MPSKRTTPRKRRRRKKPVMEVVEEHNQHIEDLMDKQTQFFWKVTPNKFKDKLTLAYWGIPPFTKDDSYSDFERQDKSSFTEMHYAVRFVHQWARAVGHPKPSKADQVTAYKILHELREEAEGVKCECCNGTGFRKKPYM